MWALRFVAAHAAPRRSSSRPDATASDRASAGILARSQRCGDEKRPWVEPTDDETGHNTFSNRSATISAEEYVERGQHSAARERPSIIRRSPGMVDHGSHSVANRYLAPMRSVRPVGLAALSALPLAVWAGCPSVTSRLGSYDPFAANDETGTMRCRCDQPFRVTRTEDDEPADLARNERRAPRCAPPRRAYAVVGGRSGGTSWTLVSPPAPRERSRCTALP